MARIASTFLPTSSTIARGSTRLTEPVIISPSRLANWSKTTSRSASRRRWRTTCLAVWAWIRPKPSLVQLLGLDEVAERGRRVVRRGPPSTVISVERILDLADDAAGPEDADLAGLRVDPDVDVLVAPDAAVGRLDRLLHRPDQLLARDLLLGVQLEEGADEIATHHRLLHRPILGR